MNLNFSIPKSKIDKLVTLLRRLDGENVIVFLSLGLSIIASLYCLMSGTILAYGDAESHLNIAKRIIQSLTPGLAQMGGIWLPLPHLMMVPFVAIEPLYRTGLAGSIVGGFSFVISALFLYRLTMLLTGNKYAAYICSLAFILNPNILYLQSTPMTELPLIMFFILSSFYFIQYVKNERKLLPLLLAGFFGFCAVLTRYDGWFLVAIEAAVIVILNMMKKENWGRMEGKVLLFSTLSFFGILLWLLWDFLILGDPFYFTNSEFSAHSQQLSWLSRGELPSFHNIFSAVLYYVITTMSNAGILIFLVALIGLILFVKNKKNPYRYLIALVLLTPFVFNIFTLFMGQSVIFIPSLTPVGYEWRLFNVRYGALAIPVIAFLFSFSFHQAKESATRVLIIALFLAQFGLYFVGYSRVITLDDGQIGLSHAKTPNAEIFMTKNYDDGLVLIDDYARTMSIIKSGIPMQDIIYVGNKPYWEVSLKAPETYARWIIMQKDDSVWKAIYDNPDVQGRLYKYFKKVYTSPQILIFKKI